MQFFVPQAKRSEYESVYQVIVESLKDQMRWPIAERKIFSLKYVHDKKRYLAEVGQLDPSEKRYEVVAILESSYYLVFTRSLTGSAGVTILVDKSEVEDAIEFDVPKPPKIRQK